MAFHFGIYLLSLHLLVLISRSEAGNGTLHRDKRQVSCSLSYTFTNVGEYVYLDSPGYSNNYGPNLNCRYNIFSPRGTQIVLNCNEFNIEYSQNCAYDKLFWSPSGDQNFRDWRYTCGTNTFSQTSTGNSLAIGFTSDGSNPVSNSVYKFRCRISVMATPCSCGQGASTRIVGGTNAMKGEIPWRVALYGQNGLFCAATLISNEWCLTAAHCLYELGSGDTIYADIGDLDVTDANEQPNQIIKIDRYIINSLYNSKTQDNDIALVHLSTPVTYGWNIQPACLPFRHTATNIEGATGTASGWGTRFFGGTQSPTMEKVDLIMHSTPTCKQIYANRFNVTNNMICAEYEGRDTCQSDSGGGIDMHDSSNSRKYCMGVVSFGFGCAQKDHPGIYAQVVNYLGWIEQNTGATFCKQ